MKTSEVLYRAADHIERYGHWKGEWFAPGGKPTELPACTIGAIGVGAQFVEPGESSAIRAFRAYLNTPGVGIVRWNDAPERTPDEVIAALRAAAVIAASRETEPTTQPSGDAVASRG